MKRVAALILNRNLPELADELGDWILQHHDKQVDLYVLENGSDPDKYSRYANILLPASLGPSGGVNEGLRQLMAKGYEYFWVNYNDARYNQEGFLAEAISIMDRDEAIALVTPYWEHNTSIYGRRESRPLVTFFSILGFVLNRRTLDLLATYPRFRFEPLWDPSNFSNHDNILATLLALYDQKRCAVTDRRFTVTELATPADEASLAARGFSAEEWKHKKGTADIEAWYSQAFPELSGSYKEKRRTVMQKIEYLIRKHNLGSIPIINQRVASFGRALRRKIKFV